MVLDNKKSYKKRLQEQSFLELNSQRITSKKI